MSESLRDTDPVFLSWGRVWDESLLSRVGIYQSCVNIGGEHKPVIPGFIRYHDTQLPQCLRLSDRLKYPPHFLFGSERSLRSADVVGESVGLWVPIMLYSSSNGLLRSS